MQFLMVAETRNDDVFLLTRLEDGHLGIDQGRLVVDENLDSFLTAEAPLDNSS